MAMIPAMTTGMTDFMMNSGFMTAMADIPQPDLAVPYAAPRASNTFRFINVNEFLEMCWRIYFDYIVTELKIKLIILYIAIIFMF